MSRPPEFDFQIGKVGFGRKIFVALFHFVVYGLFDLLNKQPGLFFVGNKFCVSSKSFKLVSDFMEGAFSEIT